MALISLYWALRLMSPIWTVIAVLVGRGAFRPVDFPTPGNWWINLTLYAGSAAWFFWIYASPPREPGDRAWLMGCGCSVTLCVNLVLGRLRGTWSFLRSG